MMTDKAPADSRLRRSVEDGDIWQGKGRTQEFLAVELHSQLCKKWVLHGEIDE